MAVKNALQSVWLVRHPPVSAGQGMCYGRTDLPVDDDALRVALQGLALWLDALGDVAGQVAGPLTGGESDNPQPTRSVHPRVRIWSSPLLRCRHLAQACQLARTDRVISLQVDDRLVELDFAAWEGLAWDAIDRGQIGAWAADPWHYNPGAGESAHNVLTRWQSFRRMLLNPGHVDGPTVDLVVTHAGVIRMALFDAGLIKESDLWLHAVPYAQPLQLV